MSEMGEGAELATELVMESSEEGEGEQKPKWHGQLAAYTLFLALITAIGALLAGVTAHESLIEISEESIDVTILEGDRVSIEILKAKHDILLSVGETPDPAEAERIAAFEEEIAELEEQTQEEEAAIETANSAHLVLAIAVTLLSVGIAVSGMAIVVDTRKLWYASMVFAAIGTVGLAYGVTKMFEVT